MKKSSKSLSVLLASTAVLGGAVVSPFFEQKVKAEVDSQTKLSTASAKRRSAPKKQLQHSLPQRVSILKR